MPGEEVPWPAPPREAGPWNGGPPVSPPGNTPLPPLPGAGGVVHGAQHQSNPWANQGGLAQPAPVAAAAPVGGASPGGPVAGAQAVPGSGQLVDRAPAWVLVASAIVVIALIAGGVYVVLKGGRQYPEKWDARVADITTWVAKERELSFKHPVKVNFLTDKQYSARATEGGGDPASKETKQYYEDQAAQLRALGFLTGDVDLGKANDTLNDSGTLAFYDPSIEQVFVRGSELTPSLRVTLAHELTHVLQDQWFDLQRIQDLEGGRAGVLRALGEGDATKVEEAYVADVLTAKERAAYKKESAANSDAAYEDIDETVPPILTTVFNAPYILGPQLIALLHQLDGWKGINGALEDPPTEEVLFDPLTFDTPAAKPREVTVTIPKGAKVLDKDEFGPITWYLMLAARLDPGVALAATDGWGGDEYVSYRKDKRVCVTAAVEGDDQDETDELARALVTWVSKSPKGTADVANKAGRVTFTTCDPGPDAKAAGGDVTPDLLSLPGARTSLYLEGLKAKRTREQSACYSRGILERFTFDQLSDPKATFIQSEAGTKIITELQQECFS